MSSLARNVRIHSAHSALIVLACIALAVNFWRGIALGERDVLYYPMFRTQTALTIALSMLHSPPAAEYRGYDDISDALVAHGLYIGDGVDDAGRRAALLDDTAALNTAINAALRVPVDTGRKSIILPGNDLGVVDFIYYAFHLFGTKLASLYYLYFTLLLLSACMFVVQFWHSRFMLAVLCLYFAIHLLMIEWAHETGPAIGSISNTRTFTLLGLLPALHLSAVLLNGELKSRLAPAIMQACILAFVISCRLDVAWEVACVIICAVFSGALYLARDDGHGAITRLFRLGRLWPAVVMLLVLAIAAARLNFAVSEAYHSIPKEHLIWENVLTALLSNRELRFQYSQADPNDPHTFERTDLQRIQEPDGRKIFVPSDLEVAGCEAVKSYLRQKHDRRGLSGSSLVCDLEQNGPKGHSRLSFPGYDQLTLRMSLEIFADHPIKSLDTLWQDFTLEMALLHNFYHLSPKVGAVPLLIILSCFLICWNFSRPFAINWSIAGRASFLAGIALVLSSVELMAAGSPHVFGAIATYLLTFLLCVWMLLISSVKFLQGRVLCGMRARKSLPLNGQLMAREQQRENTAREHGK